MTIIPKNLSLKSSRLILLALTLILLSVLLSACGGRAFIPSGWSGITISGETVYLAYNQFVYAVRLEDGKQIWRYPSDKPKANKTFYSAPVLTTDGQLLVSSYDHSLYSLDPVTGQERWSFPTKNRIVASPLATEKGIFLPSTDRFLYALDYTGKELWKFKARGALWTQPTTDPGCECIYLSSLDHYLYVLDAGNGKPLWERDMGTSLLGSPTLSDDGRLYLTSLGGEVSALPTNNNDLIWQVDLGELLWASPALDDEVLYTGDLKGTLYALNTADGTTKWKFQADGSIDGTPAVTPNGVYFTTEAGSIFGLDREKNVIFQKNLSGEKVTAKIYAGPVVVGGGVSPTGLFLVAPEGVDALLVALEPDGVQKWAFIPPK